jgi:hypothetical protein
MRNLTQIMNSFNSDKGNLIGAKHNYTPVYEKYFESYRDQHIKFVEIGIDFGQSLKAWDEYFVNGKLFMLDINNFSHWNTNKITCIQANQSSKQDMINAGNLIGNEIDFLIDDGGHCMNHHQITFAEIFPKMKDGGLYFIEDTHTCNWDPIKNPSCYGQPIMINEDRSSSTINIFKNFQKNGKFISPFLSNEECEKLTCMIDEVIIYDDMNNIVNIDSDDELNIKLDGIILIKKK